VGNKFDAGELENIQKMFGGIARGCCGHPMTEKAQLFFSYLSTRTELRLSFDTNQVCVFHQADNGAGTTATYEVVISNVENVQYGNWASYGPGIEFQKKDGGLIRVFASGKIRVEA